MPPVVYFHSEALDFLAQSPIASVFPSVEQEWRDVALPCFLSMAKSKGDHIRSTSERGTQRECEKNFISTPVTSITLLPAEESHSASPQIS